MEAPSPGLEPPRARGPRHLRGVAGGVDLERQHGRYLAAEYVQLRVRQGTQGAFEHAPGYK